MGIDVKTLAAAKKYTQESLNGSGAIQGRPGKDGIGISKIVKVSTEGLVDTYKIMLTNGNGYNFNITNGKDGHSPSISVGENNNWIINGVDTGASAKGIKGDTGAGFKIEKQYGSITEMMSDIDPVEDSVMVVVIENDTGYLYLRLPSYTDPDGITNGYLPFGSLSDVSTITGEKGNDGITPHIDPITKNWFLGTCDTGVKATGEKGQNGDTPYIGDNGNWWFGNTDSGVAIPSVGDLLEYADKNNGISDTPIGHIISIMSNSAPKHYLICDGKEYNISDYPYLTKHFEDEFQKVNYFGGDGITTFAVPDLRGEFLRGTGRNSHSNPITEAVEGSGRAVGEHQCASVTSPVGASSENGVRFMSSSGDVEMWEGIMYQDSASAYYGANSWVKVDGTNTSSRRRYFTERPTNTSVLYCIKYEPTYFITVNNNTNFVDFTNQIQASNGVTLGRKYGYVQNNMVSLHLNATFPSVGGKTFAIIPKEYAPKENTIGISYPEIDVNDINKVTYANIYSNGNIYCYVNKPLAGSYTFQFIYPLNLY